MTNFGYVLALFLGISSVYGESTLELTDSDFDSTLEGLDTALVMFYAPWCGHCKQLKPEFEKAAKDLLSNDPPVTLAKVDCTEAGKDTCGRFEVRGYPTLKIFRNGELSSDYNGPREANGIKKYMQAQVGPASHACSTEAEVEEFIKAKSEVVIVSYSEDSKEQEVFDKVANKMRETTAFAHLNKKAGDYSGIVLRRPSHLITKMEPAFVKFEGKLSTDGLSDWIKKNFHGLVGHRTTDNTNDFKNPLVVAYYEVDYVKNVKGTNYWRNRVMKVAKKFPKFNFAVSNADDFGPEMNEFGLDIPIKKNPVVSFKNAEGQKFVMSEEFSVESFEKFMNDVGAGKIEPYLKSEDIPDNSANNVKVAVAKNFKELVTDDKENDILIEFYAPWCGHCKKLAPIYDELGEAMKNEKVSIIKMDATANDVPSEFNVRGFPTLYWVPAGGSPKSYDGGRELKDFIQYISKHATNELEGYDRKGKAKKKEL